MYPNRDPKSHVKLLIKAGITEINHTSRHKRHDVARAHGLRKHFTNALRKAKVPVEVRWLLEGRIKGK